MIFISCPADDTEKKHREEARRAAYKAELEAQMRAKQERQQRVGGWVGWDGGGSCMGWWAWQLVRQMWAKQERHQRVGDCRVGWWCWWWGRALWAVARVWGLGDVKSSGLAALLNPSGSSYCHVPLLVAGVVGLVWHVGVWTRSRSSPSSYPSRLLPGGGMLQG